jgi:hypothetical protein
LVKPRSKEFHGIVPQTLLIQLNKVKLGDEETAVRPFCRSCEDSRDQDEIGSERGNYILRVDPWHFYRPFGPSWIDAPVRGAIYEFGRVRRGFGLRAWVVKRGSRLKADKVNSVWANV